LIWRRITTLDGIPAGRARERWEYDGPQGTVGFDIDVTIGKALDVVALKRTDLAEIQNYARFLADTAQQLFHSGRKLNRVTTCPCCGVATDNTGDAARIFGVAYARCDRCGHAFVREQPTPEALQTVFKESEGHSATYIDRASIEIRQAQVIRPKIAWLGDIFHRLRGRNPMSALDVGAGGGHFVAGLREAGIAAEGIEISAASRQFASEAFGIALSERDFLADAEEGSPVELVTFWGLLEYVPQPRTLLAKARRRICPNNGLLVVEVPRLNCLSTTVQTQTPDTVARHLDPTSHVNTFTDSSLATTLVKSGFKPVAAWYFGMDIYELFVQMALRLGDPAVVDRCADLIPALQASLDQGRQCDDIIVAAVPV
jgi:2-polyprenyl-3-methyl-5-hydroxy-6-metoxy-1,4-benzoquinol methylase